MDAPNVKDVLNQLADEFETLGWWRPGRSEPGTEFSPLFQATHCVLTALHARFYAKDANALYLPLCEALNLDATPDEFTPTYADPAINAQGHALARWNDKHATRAEIVADLRAAAEALQ